jgi:fructuronate reductase
MERGGESVNVSVVGVVRDVLCARQQVEAVIDKLASPATRVVTLTVSEKGYRYDPSTGRLRSDDPELVADAAGRPPRTVLGQLVCSLEARRRRGAPSLTVLCCDNLPSNGDTLRSLVGQFCELGRGAEAEDLCSWTAENVAFPNTMVDRIVPATTDVDRQRVAELIGLEDRGAVVTEPFSQWVIADRFAGPRPPWERAGASFVDDVAPYEEMKLRLLNGSHSALAYLGALAGFDFVADAMRSPAFESYVHALMDVDVTPTLNVPPGFDLPAYKDALTDRFANSALHHRTVQIAMDGTQKLPYRLLRTISSRLAAGGEPRHACLAVAGWIRYVSAGASELGTDLPLDDPLSGRLRSLADGAGPSPSAVVAAFLTLGEVFPPELAEDGSFRRLLTDALDVLVCHGAEAAVATLGTSR